MTTRKYSSRSQQTTLTAALTSSGTSATVVSGTALLGGVTISAGETFTVVIDPDTALEEIVDVTAVSTNTLTLTRGVDGSTGQAHSAGAVVRHMAIGRDYREANTHIENTTSAHGLTLANVVKTTDTGTVSSGMLATGAVGTVKIDDTAVTEAKLAPSAVTAGKIATDAVTTAKIQDSAVTSAKIANDTIVNADINSAAAIAATKIAGTAVTQADTGTVTSTMIANGTIVDADINSSAAIDKTKISGTAITAADTGTVTSTMIANDSIVNADINSSAQIAYSKTNLTNSIVNADINASAAIEWTKIAPSSTVSATELGYLDGVTSAVQTQLDSKLGTSTAASTYAPLASPALTGTPTAPTAAANTNTTQIATTAYVQTELADLVNSAPAALDTLNELAASLGNDANFATTVTNSLATKLPLAGGTMSGAIAMGTNKITGLGTPTASTDAATKNYVDTVTVAPSNLTGPITSVGSATAVASQTGTGSTFVMQASPTLTTPDIGVATATSINGTTIPTSKTLVATDSTTYVVPSQTGNSGKFLTTDGTTSSWGAISGSLAQPTEPSSPSDGLIWVDTDGTIAGQQITRWQKVLGAGVTSLTGLDDNSLTLSYTVGYEQVYLNGVMLYRGSDYTATTGTSITLSSASVASDTVEVLSSAPVAVADVYTQTQADAKYALAANQFTAGKNKIINGDFGVWQRGTSFSTTGVVYCADRFLTNTGSVTGFSAVQSAFTAGTAPVSGYEGQYYLDIAGTLSNASTGYIQVEQRIEDVRTFAGQTVTLSFWAKGSTSGTINTLFVQNFGTSGSAEVLTATSSQSITTSWQRFTQTVTLASVAGKTIGASSMLKLLFVKNMGSSYPTFGSSNYTGTLSIWGVQVEAGSVATPFQTATGTIQGELAACQRYYEPIFGGGSGGAYIASQAIVNCPFKVEKRTAPTLVTLTANCNLVQSNAAYIISTTAAYSIYAANGTQAYAVLITGLSGMTANYPVMLTNMSAAPFAASSEL